MSNSTASVNIHIETGGASKSMRELQQEAGKLNKQIRNLTPGSKEWVESTAEWRKVNGRLQELRADMTQTSQGWASMLGSVKNIGPWAAAAMAVEGAMQAVNALKQSYLDLSDQLADIQKTTGMTAAEVQELNAQMSQLSTRTDMAALREIAKVGGAIGVAKDQMLGFVESVDQAVVALGDEFGGGAETVAREMGAIQKLFKETAGLKAGEAIASIGSAINALGAAGTATGPYVAEFTQRLGALGNLKPSVTQVMGLGAALQEMGLEAAIASGGISNILLESTKRTDEYAKVLGVTTAQFKELINTNPNEVLLQLAESMKDMDNVELVNTMKDLGITSQESVKVMGLLATKTDFVREKQALANTEFAKASSLTEEFNVKNNTLAGNVEKIEKALMGAFVNSAVMNGLTRMSATMAELVSPGLRLSDKIEEERVQFNLMAMQLYDVNLKSEDRIALIKEMQAKYPDFLKNIDAEKVGNEQLAESIRLQNEQYVNKIILQKQQEQIEKVLQDQADKKQRQLDAEMKARRAIIEVEKVTGEQLVKTKSVYDEQLKTYKQVPKTLTELANAAADALQRYMGYNNNEFDLWTSEEARANVSIFGESIGDLWTRLKSANGELNIYSDWQNKLGKQAQDMAKSRADLSKQLGIDLSPIQRTTATTSDTTPTRSDGPAGPSKTSAQEKEWEALLQRLQRLRSDIAANGSDAMNALLDQDLQAFAALNKKYGKFYEEAEQLRAKNVITHKEHTALLSQLDQQRDQEEQLLFQRRAEREAQEAEKLRQKQAELMDQVAAEKAKRLPQHEQEILQIEAHYAELLKLAEEYHMGDYYIAEIYGLKKQALEDLNRKQAETMRQQELVRVNQFAVEFSNMLGAAADMVAQSGERATKFHRALMIAQIAIDTAAALSSVIRNNSATSLTPIDLAARIASGTAIVLGAFVKVNSLMKQAKAPTYQGSSQRGGSGGAKAAEGQGYFAGGRTGRAGIGYGDANGEYVGYVHADEYVTPAWLRTDPFVIATERVLEARRTGGSGNAELAALSQQLALATAGSRSAVAGSGNTDALLAQAVAVLQQIASRPVPAQLQLGQRDVRYLRDEFGRQEQVEDLSRI